MAEGQNVRNGRTGSCERPIGCIVTQFEMTLFGSMKESFNISLVYISGEDIW
jgi:hypothetical protein